MRRTHCEVGSRIKVKHSPFIEHGELCEQGAGPFAERRTKWYIRYYAPPK